MKRSRYQGNRANDKTSFVRSSEFLQQFAKVQKSEMLVRRSVRREGGVCSMFFSTIGGKDENPVHYQTTTAEGASTGEIRPPHRHPQGSQGVQPFREPAH
jgi:hypothetical protein